MAKYLKLSFKWILEKIRKEIQYKIKNRANYKSRYYLATIKTEEINKQREWAVVNE
jgi:hypothetical protein